MNVSAATPNFLFHFVMHIICIYCIVNLSYTRSMGVNCSHSMGEYAPTLLCVATANILMHLGPGTQTKEDMECAGFKQVDIDYYAYQKCIEILEKKIVASNSSQIVVRGGSIVASRPSKIIVGGRSTLSPSILKVGSGETAIIGATQSLVVRKSMTKASSVDIETKSTIPRDKIRRKTSCRLHQNNADNRNLKKRVDGAFITTTK